MTDKDIKRTYWHYEISTRDGDWIEFTDTENIEFDVIYFNDHDTVTVTETDVFSETVTAIYKYIRPTGYFQTIKILTE